MLGATMKRFAIPILASAFAYTAVVTELFSIDMF